MQAVYFYTVEDFLPTRSIRCRDYFDVDTALDQIATQHKAVPLYPPFSRRIILGKKQNFHCVRFSCNSKL